MSTEVYLAQMLEIHQTIEKCLHEGKICAAIGLAKAIERNAERVNELTFIFNFCTGNGEKDYALEIARIMGYRFTVSELEDSEFLEIPEWPIKPELRGSVQLVNTCEELHRVSCN